MIIRRIATCYNVLLMEKEDKRMNGWLDEDKKIATGSEDFKKNLMNGIRYVDKTAFLVPLLDNDHKTTFLLRPRRFGKTMTLSMIRYFVEDTRNPGLNQENRSLFQGLRIMDMGDRYTDMMTSFPVIHLTFQTVMGLTCEDAYRTLVQLICELYCENKWVLQSNCLTIGEKRYYDRMMIGKDDTGAELDGFDIVASLQKMSMFMRKATGKPVVTLIDEYDVPLEKAYRNGYYRKMAEVIEPLLQNVLNNNSDKLKFAVVTGRFHMMKEKIFNPEVNTVNSTQGGDVVVFTEQEVEKLLVDSGLEAHFEEMKEWYGGYRSGKIMVYNPWSVIKFIEDLTISSNAMPRLYWTGMSGNSIVRKLIDNADDTTREKAEKLVQGDEITFAMRNDF